MNTALQNQGMAAGVKTLPALRAGTAPKASIRFEAAKPVMALIKWATYRAVPVTSLGHARSLMEQR